MGGAGLEIIIRRLPDGQDVADAVLDLDDSAAAPVVLARDAPLALDQTRLLKLVDSHAYGQALAGQLFHSPELRSAWERTRTAQASTGGDLRIRLRIDRRAEDLHRLCWETLCDPRDGGALALHERILFARTLDSEDLASITRPPRQLLRALIVIASPTDLASFGLANINVEEEIERIKSAIGPAQFTLLGGRGDRRATVGALATALRDAPHVLYLIAHGTSVDGRYHLWLEHEDGSSARLPSDELAALIGHAAQQPLLAVLASCHSAGNGYDQAPAALGPQLAQAGIAAVIGFQGFVSVRSVSRLIPSLFDELQRDGRIDRALAAARQVLQSDGDWWQAVLWLRLRDGYLWYDLEPAWQPAAGSPVPAATRDDRQPLLGAYNEVPPGEHRPNTPRLVRYRGANHPRNAEECRSLEQAYRSEVIARYAEWKTRYAPLKLVSSSASDPAEADSIGERESRLTYRLLRTFFPEASAAPEQEAITQHLPVLSTFTDLRDGLARYGDLLLLGQPGGGKTTAMWRLALDLAEQGLYENPAAPLPVFVRLGGLDLNQAPLELAQTDLANTIIEANAGALEGHRLVAAQLPVLVNQGRVFFLWDGLNETPRVSFTRAVKELNEFRIKHPGRNIISCRSEDHDYLIEECAGKDPLPIARITVQELDDQTVRELVVRRLGEAHGGHLLSALREMKHRALSSLARTPLLLKMLCEVYDRLGALPESRGALLDFFVTVRLAWEQERSGDEWIAEDLQRRALAHLAFKITESQGRGTSVPRQWAQRELSAALQNQQVELDLLLKLAFRANLLEPLGEARAVRFSHQLLQEYFAALSLREHIQIASARRESLFLGWLGRRELQQYAAPGRRTGWEETLLLLAGMENEKGAAHELVKVFLSQPVEVGRVLLASSDALDPLLVQEVRQALNRVFWDAEKTGPERIAAAAVLSEFDDCRAPVRLDEWRHEVERRTTNFGAPPGYFCYVRPHSYRIGDWAHGNPNTDLSTGADVPLPQFWIARYPITVAQFSVFAAIGYQEAAYHWWPLPARQKQRRRDLWPWMALNWRWSTQSQPVVGIDWYETSAFCSWLTAQLRDVLPSGYVIRLPTEAEWEAAAAYHKDFVRQLYPWGDAEPTPQHAFLNERAVGEPAPAGCCRDGAAACGAHDLLGNIWEWTCSSYQGYPANSGKPVIECAPGDVDVPLRGGAWIHRAHEVSCSMRACVAPDNAVEVNLIGFRIVLAPKAD